MNTPIDFETAKLLKEKEFDFIVTWNYILGFKNNTERDKYMPTISDVCMWLYEKYGVWIWVSQEYSISNDFSYRYRDKNGLTPPVGAFKSPTEAYLEAITYTLNNLI